MQYNIVALWKGNLLYIVSLILSINKLETF